MSGYCDRYFNDHDAHAIQEGADAMSKEIQAILNKYQRQDDELLLTAILFATADALMDSFPDCGKHIVKHFRDSFTTVRISMPARRNRE